MKQQYKKVTTVVLAAALLLSCVGCANKATDTKKEETLIAQKEKQVEDIKTTGNTVYVFSDTNDSIKKIVATDDVLDKIKIILAAAVIGLILAAAERRQAV